MSKWIVWVSVGILVAAGLFLAGDRHGSSRERLKAAKAIIEFQKREANLAAQLAAINQIRQEKTREKTKVVERSVDHCLDRRVPDDVLRLFPRPADPAPRPAPGA